MATARTVYNMSLPPEGPVSIPFTLDMATQTSHEIDLTEIVNRKVVSYISGFWVDNTNNSQDIFIEANGTFQKIKIPAGAQCWQQIMATNPPKFKVSQTGAGNLVNIQFVNFPVFPLMSGVSGGGSGGGDVNIDAVGGVPVVDSVPVSIVNEAATILDFSITLDSTNQAPVLAGEAPNYLIIQNPASNGPVSVNLAGGDSLTSGAVLAAGGSLELCRGVANAITVSGTNGDVLTVFGG
jgi:hypothetical protein